MADFRTLETFMWVATLGSFRGAAVKLNTTQPAISQRIAQLEAEFGVRLLDRETRSVQPTSKGRELLVYADRLLRLRAEMRNAISERDTIRGTLRLGVAETIVQTWLPRLIERVSIEHPELSLEIDVDISPNLRDRLVAQEIDLAFLLGPLSNPTIRNQQLCRFPIVFLVSPKLPLPPDPVSLAALARYPIMTFSRRTQPYLAIRELFSRSDLPNLRLHASASLAPVVRMAVDGLGIAAVPEAIARNELESGQLRIVQTDAQIAELNFTASWPVSPDGFVAEAIGAIAIQIAAADDKFRSQ